MHERLPATSPTAPSVEDFALGRKRFNRRTWAFRRSILFLLGFIALEYTPLYSQQAAELYTSEHERMPRVEPFYQDRFKREAQEQQEKFRKRVTLVAVTGGEVPTLASLEEAQHAKSVVNTDVTTPAQRAIAFWGVLGLGVVFVIRRYFPWIGEWLKETFAPWDAMTGSAAGGTEALRVEGQAFAEFVAAFRAGPIVAANDRVEHDPVAEFFERWPKILADFRKQLQEIRQTEEAKSRRRLLNDLGRELRTLKSMTGMPELLPVWQMVSVLEGLIKQLGDKVENATQSSLRTVAGAVDLLAELCGSDVDAQLLTRRPVRLLAVDDDPISRHAIAFALKRALHEPDLANDGLAGLRLAEENQYDVIFLDVEMSGMNGFELCTQIHKTLPNNATPVVFVTVQSDFNARVQSSLRGGCELIAKPFLTFELATKALTLIIQSRLREGKSRQSRSPLITEQPVQRPTFSAAGAHDFGATKAESASTPPASVPSLTSPLTEVGQARQLMPAASGIAKPAHDVADIATEFLTRAPEHLSWVNDTVRMAIQTADSNAWLSMLADVYLRLNSFTPDEKFAKGHPAVQLSVGLERLLSKLLQSTTPPARSTMLTIGAGVELLQELCARPEMLGATHTAARLLVVDDDPMARRALTGALQATFDKPVCAENGEEALARAAECTFDAIFLDVQMPGMDGIEVFTQLRSSGCNQKTPVVFVCGRADPDLTIEMNAIGNCDIITKPFLPGELLVRALTLVLRQRCEESVTVG